MDSTIYEIYNQTLDRSLAWKCLKCGMPNFSTSLFDTMGLIDTSNRFDSLSIPDSPTLTDIGSRTATSSRVGVQHTRPKAAKKAVLNHPQTKRILNKAAQKHELSTNNADFCILNQICVTKP